MSNSTLPTTSTILILEPNSKLKSPYQHLASHYQLQRLPTIEAGLKQIAQQTPALIILSASYSASKTVYFLESLKNLQHYQLIPILIVVDLNQPVSQILGTSWGDQLAVLASNAPAQLTLQTVESLLSV